MSNININVNSNGKVTKSKNKWIAILLCLFLGGIGAHKFYEEKNGMGVLYLLFCWTGIPVCLSVIDLIILLFKPNEYYV